MSEPEKINLLKDPEGWSRGKKIGIALGFFLPLILVPIYGTTKSGKTDEGPYTTLDWAAYRQFDPATNRMPAALQALDGKKVRSLGFMVPLEDNRSEVMQFLLVPSPQACVHAPPPPSNQMIYVRMVTGPAKTIYGPVMLQGVLRVTSQTHQYGTASYQIYGEIAEPAKSD